MSLFTLLTKSEPDIWLEYTINFIMDTKYFLDDLFKINCKIMLQIFNDSKHAMRLCIYTDDKIFGYIHYGDKLRIKIKNKTGKYKICLPENVSSEIESINLMIKRLL
jgi:hypothetical protein